MALATAVAGAASRANFANDSGIQFSAVAEVYSSAVDDEGATWWTGGDGMTVPEPIEHSVVGVPMTWAIVM